MHYDKFKALFPEKTKVKCLSDAGLLHDAIDVSDGAQFEKSRLRCR
ncbi:unnamed protein product [Rhodiola kirilowii]